MDFLKMKFIKKKNSEEQRFKYIKIKTPIYVPWGLLFGKKKGCNIPNQYQPLLCSKELCINRQNGQIDDNDRPITKFEVVQKLHRSENHVPKPIPESNYLYISTGINFMDSITWRTACLTV